MTGVGQVEEVLLLLRIEHQSILIRLFHRLRQVTEHLLRLFFSLFPLRSKFMVVLGQFRPQDGQRLLKVLLLEHGTGLYRDAQHQGEDDDISFHWLFTFSLFQLFTFSWPAKLQTFS